MDLLIAGRNGFELAEDFLSAISLVSGSTFGSSVLVQVARLNTTKRNCDFLQFLTLPANRWYQAVSQTMLDSVRSLLAHWDGLESGKRLRRGARRYRDAAGTLDDIAAFQEAYIGLEAMEPPLAKMFGLNPGTEEIKGTCDHCGYEFTRNRTSLVGVRAFVLGTTKSEEADGHRKKDWKLINKLRNDLMHGLADDSALSRRPHDAFVASMHYLHDAVLINSHSAQHVSESYSIARGAARYVLGGSYAIDSWSKLQEWAEVLGTSPFRWVPHAAYDLVPEIAFNNPGLADLEVFLVSVRRLRESFESVSGFGLIRLDRL